MKKPPIETMIDSFVYHEYLSDDGDWGSLNMLNQLKSQSVALTEGLTTLAVQVASSCFITDCYFATQT